MPSPSSPASGYGPPLAYPAARRLPRPTSVTVAIVLIMVGFVILMIDSATLVAARDDFVANIDAAAQATGATAEQVDELKSSTDGGVYVGACSPLVLALALLPMGLFVLRGRDKVRIALCITVGVAMMCAVCCSSMQFIPSAEDGAFYSQVQEANLRTRPPAFLILPGIAVAMWAAAIILLLLPASSAYFRSRKPTATY